MLEYKLKKKTKIYAWRKFKWNKNIDDYDYEFGKKVMIRD